MASFFDDLTRKAKDVAYVAADKAKDVAAIAADKAKDAAEITKINVAIAGEQRDMDKGYRIVGEWFVNEYEGEIPDEIRAVVETINAARARIAELQGEKCECKCEHEELATEEDFADAPEKVCPICGATSDSRFCPQCGAPMGDD